MGSEAIQTEAEIAKRRDDAIRRALNTPPSPLKDKPKKRPTPAKADGGAARPRGS